MTVIYIDKDGDGVKEPVSTITINSQGDFVDANGKPGVVLNHSAALAAMGMASRPLCLAIAGQSNSVGQGLLSDPLEPTQGNIYNYNHLGQLVAAVDPIVTPAYASWDVVPIAPSLQSAGGISALGAPGAGFPLRLAKLLAAASGIPVTICHGGVANTKLSDWLPQTWATDDFDKTTLFGNFNNRLRSVLPANTSPPFIVWYQGESEAYSPDNYVSDFHTVLYHFRRVWGASLPIIIVQLGTVGSAYSSLVAPYCQIADYQRQCELGSGVSTVVNLYNYHQKNYQLTDITLDPAYATGSIVNGATDQYGNNPTLTVTVGSDGLKGFSIPWTNTAKKQIRLRINSKTGGGGNYVVFYSNFVSAGGSNILGGTFNGNVTEKVYQYSGSASNKAVFYVLGTVGDVLNMTLFVEDILTALPSGEATELPNTYLSVAHDLPRSATDAHLSTAAQRELGRRIALSVRENIFGDLAVDGSGPRFIASAPVTKGSTTTTVLKFDRSLTNTTIDHALFTITDTTASANLAASAAALSTTALANDTVTITHAASGSAGNARTISYGAVNGPAINTWRANVIRGLSPDPLGNVLGLPAPEFYSVSAV